MHYHSSSKYLSKTDHPALYFSCKVPAEGGRVSCFWALVPTWFHYRRVTVIRITPGKRSYRCHTTGAVRRRMEALSEVFNTTNHFLLQLLQLLKKKKKKKLKFWHQIFYISHQVENASYKNQKISFWFVSLFLFDNSGCDFWFCSWRHCLDLGWVKSESNSSLTVLFFCSPVPVLYCNSRRLVLHLEGVGRWSQVGGVILELGRKTFESVCVKKEKQV